MPLPRQTDPRLWLALLYEIDQAGGQVKPRDLYARLERYFPEITPQDLQATNRSGQNKWRNRIQWVRQRLVQRGLLSAQTPGLWTITEAGRAWLRQHWRGPAADDATVSRPPVTAPAGQKTPPARTLAEPPAAGDLAVVRLDPVAALVRRLQTAQRRSEAPHEFESALAEAFAFLGFAVERLGGPGETDLVLTAHLGADSYRVIVDAKTSKNGKVTENQINWPVLAQHRKHHGATDAVVVGEEFGGGNLLRFATEYGVTLLRTADLGAVLELHAATPFTLLDLRDLFATTGPNHEGLAALRRRSADAQRRWRLLGAVIAQMAHYARIPQPPRLTAEALYAVFIAQAGHAGSLSDVPSLDDLKAALEFLSNPALGILRHLPGSDDAFHLTLSPQMAWRRLSALARTVEATLAPLAATAVGTGSAG